MTTISAGYRKSVIQEEIFLLLDRVLALHFGLLSAYNQGGKTGSGNTGTQSFPIAFSRLPTVTAVQSHSGWDTKGYGWHILNITVKDFGWHTGSGSAWMYYVAFGI